eukprot:4730695-Amphidinium_carterae.1
MPCVKDCYKVTTLRCTAKLATRQAPHSYTPLATLPPKELEHHNLQTLLFTYVSVTLQHMLSKRSIAAGRRPGSNARSAALTYSSQ